MSVITAVIDSVTSKEGTNRNGKPYTKWAIKSGDDWYSTFTRSVIEPAYALEGKPAVIEYEVDGNFKNLKSVKAADGEAATQAVIQNKTANGDTDWDLIGLRKTRCALWAAYLGGDAPKAVISTVANATPQAINLAVYKAGVDLLTKVERDIFYRADQGDDADIPF